MPGSRNAGSRAAVSGRIKRARHLEGRQIDEPVRSVRPCVGVANNVRPRKELAGVVVIIEQRQMKRIATPQRDNCVQLPAVAEAGVGFSEVWNTVTGRSDKSMTAIKV